MHVRSLSCAQITSNRIDRSEKFCSAPFCVCFYVGTKSFWLAGSRPLRRRSNYSRFVFGKVTIGYKVEIFHINSEIVGAARFFCVLIMAGNPYNTSIQSSLSGFHGCRFNNSFYQCRITRNRNSKTCQFLIRFLIDCTD